MADTPALAASEPLSGAVHSAPGAVRPARGRQASVRDRAADRRDPRAAGGWPAVTPACGVRWPVSCRTGASVGPQSPDANITDPADEGGVTRRREGHLGDLRRRQVHRRVVTRH